MKEKKARNTEMAVREVSDKLEDSQMQYRSDGMLPTIKNKMSSAYASTVNSQSGLDFIDSKYR